MLERLLEGIEERGPRRGYGVDGLELNAAAALHDVVVENLGVVLLFLKLYLEPAGDAALALGVAVGSHGQIEVGRPKFGIDLRIERVFYTFVKHNILNV